ncbi:hypothetical protein Plhal304r1_c004g0017121 [Plasmopara halstedii]
MHCLCSAIVLFMLRSPRIILDDGGWYAQQPGGKTQLLLVIRTLSSAPRLLQAQTS